MSALISLFARLGVTEGITFRAVHEDGVGFVIEPNPAPTRQQPQTLANVRRLNRRASGWWVAKPVHIGWGDQPVQRKEAA